MTLTVDLFQFKFFACIQKQFSELASFYIGLIQECAPTNMDAVARKFDELVEAFAEDDKDSGYVMHGMLFKALAEEQPEVNFFVFI